MYGAILVVAIGARLIGGAVSSISLLLAPILAGFFYYYRVTARIKQRTINSVLAYTSLANKSYFVYLRSFDRSGHAIIRNTVGGWTERSLIGQSWDIEHALAAALGHEGLLVAIGQKRETLGAAKFVAADDEWQQRFYELCTDAKGIFVLPDYSPSLRWEIGQVISDPDIAAKTFFLMPPQRFGFFSVRRHLGRRSRWWKKTQLSLGAEGVAIPDYHPRGEIFQLGADGTAINHRQFGVLREGMLLKLFEGGADEIKIKKRWFERWPITWTIFAPGVVLPVLIAAFFAIGIHSLLWHPFNIPSGSMKPTLLVGDYLMVSKFSYGWGPYSFPGDMNPITGGRILGREPQRGDVVVFRLPKDDTVDYVKRVVGLPGERIQMKDGRLYINDVAVDRRRIEDFVGEDPCGSSEEMARVKRWKETLPNGVSYEVLDCVDNGFYDNTNVYTVPPGHFFMMGDNRDNSTDSRVVSAVGYVPYNNLVGKAQIVFFSLAEGSHIWQVWDWSRAIRWDRLFKRIS